MPCATQTQQQEIHHIKEDSIFWDCHSVLLKPNETNQAKNTVEVLEQNYIKIHERKKGNFCEFLLSVA